MSDTPQQDFYAQSLVEQLSDLVDGIADFNAVAFGGSMRRHRGVATLLTSLNGLLVSTVHPERTRRSRQPA
jgi:hypothetical protein